MDRRGRHCNHLRGLHSDQRTYGCYQLNLGRILNDVIFKTFLYIDIHTPTHIFRHKPPFPTFIYIDHFLMTVILSPTDIHQISGGPKEGTATCEYRTGTQLNSSLGCDTVPTTRN